MWFAGPFLLFLGVGALGVASLLPLVLVTARRLIAEDPALGVNANRLALLLLLNPALLLAAGAAAGVLLADRVGLRSLLLDLARGRAPDWPALSQIALAVGMGLGVALVVLAVTEALRLAGAGLPEAGPDGTPGWSGRLSALLYGGVTEEIMLRFGLMTLLIWAGSFLLRTEAAASAPLAWVAILASALVFGAGHLPAAAATLGSLGAGTVAQIVLLNAVAGVAFGWIYWRINLEAAMVAHMAAHVGFWTMGKPVAALVGRAGGG